MKRFSDLGNYLSETNKYASIEITMDAKMKLIYHPLSQIWGEQSCAFHLPGSNGWGITIKEERDESNLGGSQMDNTNRKCIFGNDLSRDKRPILTKKGMSDVNKEQ